MRPWRTTGNERSRTEVANGQRFIIWYEPSQPNVAITLVENWGAEWKKK